MSATILYNQAMRQIAEISQALDALSRAPMEESLSSPLLAQVSAQLSHLGQSLGELEGFAKREVTAVKRDIVSSRASKIRSELKSLQDSFERQKAQRLAAKERDELLQGRAGGQGMHNRGSHPPSTNPADQDSTVLLMDMFAREGQVLGSSGDQIEQYISVSKNALQELYEQRGMLKSTQRRLLDAANTLGLSSTVIRFIEQRTVADRYILWGGIFTVILFTIGFLYYFG